MNVFDLDGTIIDGDTGTDFYLYLLARHPWLFYRSPQVLLAGALFWLGLISSVQMRNLFYPAFMPYVSLENEVIAFWMERKCKLKPWYLEMRRPDDIITTASPECLVRPLTEELGVRLIAADVDSGTGKVIGRGNRDVAKPINFRFQYPDAVIEKFYSDSLSDSPMAELAEEAFLVLRNGDIMPWPWHKVRKRK